MNLFFVSWVVAGVVLAYATIRLARALQREQALLSAALILLGVWYLGWGLADGRSFEALLPQVVGGAFFALCGVLGLRFSLLFASLGWSLHAGWDFLSPALWDVSYMPSWTAPACLGYDVLLGIHLFRLWREASEAPGDAAPSAAA